MSFWFFVVTLSIITLPCWLFQISVLIFLICLRCKKSNLFESTCFILFIMLEVVNCLNELTLFFTRRLSLFPTVQNFYSHSTLFSNVLLKLNLYTLYAMCFLRVGIAINQLNCVHSITSNSTQSLKIYGRITVYLTPFFPFLLLIRQMFSSTTFFKHADGTFYVIYNDFAIQAYQSVVTVGVLFSTSMLSFCVSLVTNLKYRSLSKLGGISSLKVKRSRFDYRLFWQSTLVLFIQALLCFTQLLLLVAIKKGNPNLLGASKVIYGYTSDAFCLVNSITLILMSKYARRNYFAFWNGVWRFQPYTGSFTDT